VTAAEGARPEPSASRSTRPAGAALIALYPAAWQRRYGDELFAHLEAGGLSPRDRLDLLRGALDAHLHPSRPSMLPVISALTAGALATAHAIALAAQPVPLDWPGYLADALPLALLGVALLLPAVVALWLRLGDADGVLGRLGVVIALAGHCAWLVALAAAALQIEYGPLTAAAATVAMLGTALLGVALAGRRAALLGALLVVAALAGVAPPALGWPVFAGAWSAIGFRLLLDARRRGMNAGRSLHA
jgi:hypothetical protein